MHKNTQKWTICVQESKRYIYQFYGNTKLFLIKTMITFNNLKIDTFKLREFIYCFTPNRHCTKRATFSFFSKNTFIFEVSICV